jgi:aspartyl-tRNA(Asn)/glutamyl-tRNA(Gln) amidotransferase subunit B
MYRKTQEITGKADLTLPTIPTIKISAEGIVKEKGLVQISDSGEIEKAVDDVISKYLKEAERYRAGEEKLMGFFVGQVMKVTKGKANPQMVNELLKQKLSS